jgi:hypothetical protein
MGFQRIQSDHGLYIYLRDGLRILCKDLSKIDSVIQELSQHFKLQDLGPTHYTAPGHPDSVVGSLVYLAVTTRPDIAYSAGVLARFHQQKVSEIIADCSQLQPLQSPQSAQPGPEAADGCKMLPI